jgi:hypothetical protein
LSRLIALLVVAALMLVPAPVLAGNGTGKGAGGGGSATTTPAWVSASPNPAGSWGTRVELNGCGYDVNYSAEVRIRHSAGYTESYGVVVWYTGCLNVTPFVTKEPGSYTIEVFQRQRLLRKGLLLKASTTLTVAG